MDVKFLTVLVACCITNLGFTSGAAIRLCVSSTAEENKCKAWSAKAGASLLTCVSGTGDKNCAMRISQKEADVASFKAQDIVKDGMKYGLKVVAGASRNGLDSFTAYYAIAVIKKGTKWTFDNLKGQAKSCHTGVMKNAGWRVPVGFLLESKRMTVDDSLKKSCIYKAVADFFKASCAPGANDKKYNEELYGEKKLCELCIGDAQKQNKCKRSSAERYYDYTGALKCLKEGAGDISFIKQSTLLADAGVAGYSLLCRDNTHKAAAEYKTCSLARVPEKAVLTYKGKSQADVDKIAKFLTDASASDGKVGLKLFDGVIFSKDTDKLEKVATDKQAYDKFVSKEYREAVEKINVPCSGHAIQSSLGILLAALAICVSHVF